jgi:hypothetical protein
VNVYSIDEWIQYLPEINPIILQEYLLFCRSCSTSSATGHNHHIFPKSFSKHCSIPEIPETVYLEVEEHLHAHELLYLAIPPGGVLKSKAAGAVYRLRTGCKVPQIGRENPNFEKGFLWWWKNQYSQEEYDAKLNEFKLICSKRSSGEGNPMYGKQSVNKGKGYYKWWVEKYGESTAAEMEKSFRKRVAEKLREYFKTHEGTFTGKKHTEDTKRKLSEIAKKRTNNGHSKPVYCVETGEQWKTTRQLAQTLGICESTLSQALKQGEYVQNEQHYRRGISSTS